MKTATAATLPSFSRHLAASSLWVKAGAVLLGSALIAASAQIVVPMVPVPMTMQTYALLIVGALYGSRLGFATVIAYLAEGAMGLPVFNAGAGGAAHFFGTTGGFLLGFPFVALAAGWLMERGWGGSLVKAFAALTAAHLVVFLFGVPWLAVLIGWEKAFSFGFLPFVLGTLVKTGLAVATWEAALRVGARRG